MWQAFAMVTLLLAAVLGLFLAGRWLSRALARHRPDDLAVAQVTPTGVVLAIAMAVAVTGGLATRVFAPDSALGRLLGSFEGAGIALMALIGAYAWAWAALHMLGHPPIRWRGLREP